MDGVVSSFGFQRETRKNGLPKLRFHCWICVHWLLGLGHGKLECCRFELLHHRATDLPAETCPSQLYRLTARPWGVRTFRLAGLCPGSFLAQPLALSARCSLSSSGSNRINLIKALAGGKSVHGFLDLRCLFAENVSDVDAVCRLELTAVLSTSFLATSSSFLAIAAAASLLCCFVVFAHRGCGGRREEEGVVGGTGLRRV